MIGRKPKKSRLEQVFPMHPMKRLLFDGKSSLLHELHMDVYLSILQHVALASRRGNQVLQCFQSYQRVHGRFSLA